MVSLTSADFSNLCICYSLIIIHKSFTYVAYFTFKLFIFQPAVSSKRVDPRLLYSAQVAKSTPASSETPSSANVPTNVQSPDASSSSDEETDYSEVNINDPIVKQYAKVNSKKLEKEDKMGKKG